VKIDPFSFDITPSSALTEALDASVLFQATASHSGNSPIDQYLENSNKLSKIYTNSPFKEAMTPELGAVLLLGYVSAVESYMRGIIRGLVHIDEHTKNLAAPKPLTYFAASIHDPKLLPEALFESVSFSGAGNVSATLKEFCGITGMGGSNYPKELKRAFEKFSDICQLRHCCVHRFGLLGAGNAHKLGVEDKNLIEKPLVLTVDALEDISTILEKFILSLNSYIYRDVLERSFTRSKAISTDEVERQYKIEWTRDYTQDESRFVKYYNLFAVTSISPSSISVIDSYTEFQQWMNDAVVKMAKEKAFAAKARQKSTQPGIAPTQPASIAPAVPRSASPFPAQSAATIPVKQRGRLQKLLSWFWRILTGSNR
jgi:hypothetical protein